MGLKLIEIENLLVKGYTEDDIFGSMMHSGTFFEKDILDRWLPWAREADTIFDVGANLGNHSLYWATRTNARIHSFEPYSVNFDLLVSNIKRNHLDHIKAVEAAAGAVSGRVVLSSPVPASHLGNAAFHPCDHGGDAPMVALNDYTVSENIRKVDFVKIDTEGMELDVMRGMQLILDRDHPDLWVETEPDHVDELLGFLNGFGYFLADLDGMNCFFLSDVRRKNCRPMSESALLKTALMLRMRAVKAEIRYNRLMDKISRGEKHDKDHS